MSVLIIAVPRSRRFCGRATGISKDGRSIFGPIRILATASARVARAHGNTTCSPTLPFGHPPAGSYVIAESLPPGAKHRRPGRYGRLGGLVLDPVGGDAAAIGRRIVLHGGSVDLKGRLRPTRGGLRVSDRDMTSLIAVINATNAAGDSFKSVELVEIAEHPLTRRAADRPGGRRTLARRGSVDIARRRFLSVSAVLLAGIGAGAAGCLDESPSNCPPSSHDFADAGPETSTSTGCQTDDGYTNGGGVG